MLNEEKSFVFRAFFSNEIKLIEQTSCDVIPYESYLNSKLVGANVKYALTGSSFSHLNENFPDLFEKVCNWMTKKVLLQMCSTFFLHR